MDKTLEGVVREVIGETITSKQPNLKELSTKTGETQSGGTPVYVAGVDISDIPEQDRPRIQAKLETKLKLLEQGYQPKFQEVANLKKSLEWLSSKGLTAQKAEEILMKHVEGEKLTKTEKNTLDRLMDESPLEQKEALQNMRKIVKEETGIEGLRAELAELKKTNQYLASKDMQLGESRAISDLESLKTTLDSEFVEKNKEAVLSEWRKYPQSKVEDILYYTDRDGYKQALLSKGNRKEEKINAVTNNNSGVVSTANLNVRKSSLKDILTSVIKEKRG